MPHTWRVLTCLACAMTAGHAAGLVGAMLETWRSWFERVDPMVVAVPERAFSEAMRLDVPAEYAFAFLADPSTAPVIDPAIREYTPDSVPMREGTRNVIRFRMWGLPVRVTSIVREWDPGRRMVMENIKPSRPVRVVATHSFTPEGETCTYTWAMELHSSDPIGAVVGRVFARFMQSNARAQQVRFRREVERRFQHEEGT